MVLFKDIGKPASDLLGKGFPHEKPWELEYKYKSKNPQITNVAGVGSHGGFDASSSLVYSAGEAKAEVKVFSAGRSYVDLSYKIPQLPNLIISTKYERKGEKNTSDLFDFSTEYVTPRFHSILNVNPLLRTFSSSGTFTYDRFRFGGEVSGKLDASGMKYALAASYSAPTPGMKGGSWMAAVKTAPAGSLMFGKVIGSLNGRSVEGRGAELAAEVEYNIAENKSNISFGGLWHLSEEKDTIVKSKISQNGLLAVALSHRLCSNLQATIGTQLDVTKAQNADNCKYGIKIDVVS
ncbi:porin, putative [Eimeria tenella]|uniref:Porin, putative n=1 Tax=Eimeria tenella TaxID=5802 RepID=U6KV24_EIMTE|nr:porin, putative [Eimeria tenella]CDJ41957.1 porin, putative [Eimeria tenella]|eukprot:XP_013232707.1 porin, putative [Eimeria tenella]